MKVYASHSRSFDFVKDFYRPLSSIAEIEWVFPHESSEKTYPVLELMKSGTLHCIVAETSYPSTGQGIELGWAYLAKIPLVCVFKAGLTPPSSLGSIANGFVEYSGQQSLINAVKKELGIIGPKGKGNSRA